MSDHQLQRSLRARHLIMIALGGSIGTGLFLASGSAIHEAGPGGAMLAYIIISIMVYFLMCSLGEMAAHTPTSGTFCEYSTKYVSPAFGFAMGWNYWFNWAITISAEIIAASLVMQYWFPHVSSLIWSAFFFILIFGLNLFAVRVYGETEYWLSFIKVAFVIIFIVIGFLTIIGVTGIGGPVGFENWHIKDAPFNQGFVGFMAVFLIAGFSFQGTELVGVAAGEADNPRKSIPQAIKRTFWRLVIFYILAIGIISFLIPYTSNILVNPDSSVAMSPFTIVFKNAGLQSAASIMNAVILIAILSACNASMYSATRILWHLGKTKQAPRLFARVNRKGIPMNALYITAILGCFFFLTSFFQNGAVFIWLVNISSLAGFVAWFGIAFSHYRFRRAYIKQGYSIKDLPYKAKWFPVAPIIAMILITIIIFGQELNDIFSGEISWFKFLSTYIGFILFVLIWMIYKIKTRTSLIPLKKCDIKAG
ncbi:MAG: amino acid permease [Francisellaceae bacterium]